MGNVAAPIYIARAVPDCSVRACQKGVEHDFSQVSLCVLFITTNVALMVNNDD